MVKWFSTSSNVGSRFRGRSSLAFAVLVAGACKAEGGAAGEAPNLPDHGTQAASRGTQAESAPNTASSSPSSNDPAEGAFSAASAHQPSVDGATSSSVSSDAEVENPNSATDGRTESLATVSSAAVISKGADGGAQEAGPLSSEDGKVEGIVAVGYGGMRLVSRDQGETWLDEVHWSSGGGDDYDLLRTIAYGNGLWVSGGWKVTTSEDGVHWNDRGSSRDVIEAIGCQITDGLAFGNGRFLVACGSGLASSIDGLRWTAAGETPDVGGHPYILFDTVTSKFACSGDDGASFLSDDGTTWERVELDHVHLCASGFVSRDRCPSYYHAGVFLTAEWGGHIKRSPDGQRWDTVYTDGSDNNVYTEYAFAVGRVAP